MFDTGEAIRKLVMNAARYSGIAPLLSSRLSGIGVILMLHRVTDTEISPLGVNRHLAISPAFLDAALAEMKAMGYRFVGMDEALELLRAGGSGERFAVLTADDGYRDNMTEALPVLEKHEVPITVYVAPGLIDCTATLWWEVIERAVAASERITLETAAGPVAYDCSTRAARMTTVRAVHDLLATDIAEEAIAPLMRRLAADAGIDCKATACSALLDWDGLRSFAAHPLVTIGAHTVHHYNLRRLAPQEARSEIALAASTLEERLGVRPRHMAYPYGYEAAVGEREVELAREAGYASAVTTRHGVLRPGHAEHLHALPRLSVNGRYQRISYLRTMLSGVTTPIANSGRQLVTV